jgi:hypothetical protein
MSFQFDDPLDQLIWDSAADWGYDTTALSNGTLANDFVNTLKDLVYNPDTGEINWAGILTGAAGAYSLFGGGSEIKPTGWSEPPPKLDATRMQVPVDNTNRRPGEAGQRYFTDIQYTPQGNAEALQGARTAATAQAQQLAQRPARQPQTNPYVGTFKTPWERGADGTPAAGAGGGATGGAQVQTLPVPTPEQLNQQGGIAMAAGGQVPQFKGPLQSGGFVVPGDVVRHADPAGQANKERGLAALNQTLGAQAIRGPGDAMSDSIPTTIDGRQPAAVANGEAYVPKQNVAKAGGADKLYQMMEKLRLERTGSKKQINPDNPQELARAYQGGEVKRFNAGGGISSGTETPTAPAGMGQSTVNTLAPYIGEYVTSALGKGAAMANSPYQAYTGPLTAGASGLQQQAFAGIQSLAGAGFTPEQYNYQTGQFSGQTANQYMNPYISAALNPQMEEMKRQADIARLDDASRLTKAGAYGGSRQAIMESEGRRNLMDTQRKALGEGYMNAYDRGLQQYNLEQGKRLEAQGLGEKSRQYSAEFGLKSLADMAKLGDTQRAIEAEGVAADKAAFEEERQYAYAQPAYQLGLLSGIPIGGSSQTTPNTTGLSTLQGQLNDLLGIYRDLSGETD